MHRWRGKVAVVTGASAGIGASICKSLVEEGMQVVGLARRVEKTQELVQNLSGKPGTLHAIKCDVTRKDDVIKAFKWTENNVGPVNVLLNNAGMYVHGSITEGNPNDWQSIMDTNVVGLTHCSQLAIQQMKQHDIAGHIIHLNSISGHIPLAWDPPVLNVYSPSKHAVTCLAEIMRMEMRHYNLNIKITNLSPGLVKTGIFEVANAPVPKHNLHPHLKTEDVTDAVLYVLGTPPHIQIQELIFSHISENAQKF